MRRDFELGPSDIQALTALECPWEAVRHGPTLWLIIHNFPVPPGYNVEQARVAIRLDTYPPGPIDMAYFLPALARADGRPIGALTPFALDGATYQQWSRHYSWKAGEDSLATHLRKVRSWLKHEFRKR